MCPLFLSAAGPTLWEGSALFELWEQELELIYGDLRQRLSPNAKTDTGFLGDRFGFDTPPELPRLLQSIQTFYSVLIKLIAWNTFRVRPPNRPDGASLRKSLCQPGYPQFLWG